MLDSLPCGSWLVYATRAESANAIRIRDIVLNIKRDRLHAESRRPYAEVVIERLAAALQSPLRELFSNEPVLVPVPGAGLTRPGTVWAALSLCRALYGSGLGASVATPLQRTHAVAKSAGNQNRPSLHEHYESFTVQGTLDRPRNMLLVDDVVTSGTTLLAGARRLNEAFPGATIAAFALARVQSQDEPPLLVECLVERLMTRGERCRRTT